MGHLKNALRAILPNPFIKELNKLTKAPKIGIFWNRGLGDIPLEIFPLLTLLYKHKPHADVTIITREDLYQGFLLLDFPITVLQTKNLKRKQTENYSDIFEELKIDPQSFDVIFYKPDPAYWAKKTKKNLICRLKWQNSFFKPFDIPQSRKIAVLHLHSETVYGFEKNLPSTIWHEIIADLKTKGYFTVGVGFNKDSGLFDLDMDLRGKTDLHQLMSMMISYNPLFIGPDSGLLNLLYFLDYQQPFHLISFWANPRVGLLKQGTPSPNLVLKNEIILAPSEDLSILKSVSITSKIPEINPLKDIDCDFQYFSEFDKHKLESEIVQARTLIKNIKFSSKQNQTEYLNPDYENLSDFKVDERVMPIILAGGHGTRLQSSKPKALFEIQNLSLIGHFAAKIKKASEDSQKLLKAIVIVSTEGYDSIKKHLEDNSYFGLELSQLLIIVQKNIPFLSLEDKFVLKDKSSIHQGPNGNGDVFKLLKDHNIFNQIDKRILGFEIIPIDNPLAPIFGSFHARSFLEGYQASILSIHSSQDDRTLGKLAVCNKQLSIIEYIDHPPSHLSLSNTGLLGFSLDFAINCAQKELPVHTALKNYPCFDGHKSVTTKIKKFETFIFDHLMWAEKVKVYAASKNAIFQPLKELSGPYGVESLEKALALQSI